MDLLRSLPLGLYLEQPVTWLHRLDPRVKIAWLLSFLFATTLANVPYRIAMAALLIIIALSARIPWRALKQQLGFVLLFGGLMFVVSALLPDSTTTLQQPRLPLETAIITKYQFVLLQFKLPFGLPFGNFLVTRKSFNLGIYSSTLLFTLIYSATIFLLTTAPEEITAGLEKLMQPLKWFKVPVTEIALTLTLALRFIPLVLEEIQNLVRSITTRGINWDKLGIKNSAKVWMIVSEKFLENLLMRAEQIAIAMQLRGFTTPNEHQVEWQQLRIRTADVFALVLLVVLWIARILWGQDSN
jgi:energy-coupling factor transport system permease protein